jgi:hypothetical protein
MDTSCRAWTSILALYSPSGWEIFKHTYTGLVAYSRRPSNHAITTLLHQATITSSLDVTGVRTVVGLCDTVTPLLGPVIACRALNPPLQHMLTEHPSPRMNQFMIFVTNIQIHNALSHSSISTIFMTGRLPDVICRITGWLSFLSGNEVMSDLAMVTFITPALTRYLSPGQPPCHVSVENVLWGAWNSYTASTWAIQSCGTWSLVTMFSWKLQHLPHTTLLVVWVPPRQPVTAIQHYGDDVLVCISGWATV